MSSPTMASIAAVDDSAGLVSEGGEGICWNLELLLNGKSFLSAVFNGAQRTYYAVRR